jgi:hypothetical protein
MPGSRIGRSLAALALACATLRAVGAETAPIEPGFDYHS